MSGTQLVIELGVAGQYLDGSRCQRAWPLLAGRHVAEFKHASDKSLPLREQHTRAFPWRKACAGADFEAATRKPMLRPALALRMRGADLRGSLVLSV